MNANEFFYLSGIEKKASKVVYFKHNINRHELNMLVGLSAFLRLHNRVIISSQLFTQWLGMNRTLKVRSFGYLKGLITKGALHRLSYRRPDGNCLAISNYGIQVLQCFDLALMTIQKQDKIKGPSYQYLSLDLDHLPDGYKLMQVGRAS